MKKSIFKIMWTNGYIEAFSVALTLFIYFIFFSNTDDLFSYYTALFILSLIMGLCVWFGFIKFTRRLLASRGYLIKNGHHYSGHLPKIHFGKTQIKFKFKLSKECYFSPHETDDLAINKLYGISYGHHHENSIRIGWSPSATHGLIDLFFYSYNKGIRHTRHFLTIPTEQEYEGRICISPDKNLYGIYVKDKDGTTVADSMPFVCPFFRIGYYLFPYFGGKNTAPWDMRIFITNL